MPDLLECTKNAGEAPNRLPAGRAPEQVTVERNGKNKGVARMSQIGGPREDTAASGGPGLTATSAATGAPALNGYAAPSGSLAECSAGLTSLGSLSGCT